MTISLDRIKEIAAENLCECHDEDVRCGVCDGILMARELLRFQWIAVKDERPPRGGIFCCGPAGGVFWGLYRGGYSVDHFDELSCTAFDDYNGTPRRFLYWMALPDKPEQFKEQLEGK